MTDPVILAAEIYTFIVIITASAVFARLALKSKSLGRFRVQLSIFILIWAAAEIPRAAMNLGLVSTSSFGTVGLSRPLHLYGRLRIFRRCKGIQVLRSHARGGFSGYND